MEIKGGLKLIVLKILNNKDFTGYGLIKEIEDKTGFWRPSPGSMYPLMDDLLKKGLVICKKEKNQKIYSITKEGKAIYKKIFSKKDKMIQDLFEGIKFLEALGEDKEELKHIIDFLRGFEKGDFPFKENYESLTELRTTFFKVAKDKKNSREVNKILKEASKKLSKLRRK